MAKARRPHRRAAVTRKRTATSRRARKETRTPAKLAQRREIDALRAQLEKHRRTLRHTRAELRRTHAELARLHDIETEAEALRRELGPQRPLPAIAEGSGAAAVEPWIPPVVEAHLTALHDHDLTAVEATLAPDALVAESPFAGVSARGREAALAFHDELFSIWSDFRFMPRHWHNLGGAAFLEGNASFVHRGERRGMRGNGKLVSLDMMLVYHLSGDQIDRIKLYYDTAAIRSQLAMPAAQGRLF